MRILTLVKTTIKAMVLCGIIVGCFVAYLWAGLPDSESLLDVKLQVPMRIVTSDAKIIAEYGEKRRIPYSIEDIPKLLIRAVIATEDRRFYEHPGVDARGLARAILVALKSGRKEQGASTITMQVARNFFLSREKTYSRKINEILLALKIDQDLPKDTILELYLNKIYFGKNAYGVAAAAQVYYGKTLSELSLAEMAMIAGLPQAPSAINPLNNPTGALKRRNHVLSRMHHYGFIETEDYERAKTSELTAQYHQRQIDFHAPYVAEATRQAMLDRYGDSAYTDGYIVYTTVHSQLQGHAENAVQGSLLDYDQRHGFRGPVEHFALPESGHTLFQWRRALHNIPTYPKLKASVIVEVTPAELIAMTDDGQLHTLILSEHLWLKKVRRNRSVGPEPTSFEDIFSYGDVVYLGGPENHPHIAQLPEASAALVAMDPDTGAVLAMMGGYDFKVSNFNRAVQSQRQPGSVFKPFVYLAALEKGFTAASLINDSPWVQSDRNLEGEWRPQNDTKNFLGPTRLRMGIVKSQNLVSIRLLDAIGLKFARDLLGKIGFDAKRLPNGLSLALGTLHTSPLEMAGAYSTLANGGYRIEPFIIEHIEDYEGRLIHRKYLPPAPDEPVVSSQATYIMNDILRDAIQNGTGKRAKELKRSDLGGKTGTTNDLHDNWFAGFNRHLVCVTWLGFDEPQSTREYASQSALPIWMSFMDEALKGQPEVYLERPDGLVTVQIDPQTGLLAHPKQTTAIFELFRADKVPTEQAPWDKSYITEKSKAHQDTQSLF